MALSVSQQDLLDKLSFAERRLNDVKNLNDGRFYGANVLERQQLLQECFFHLVGAVEMLAQLVNWKRHLALPPDEVSISKVAQKLSSGDPVRGYVDALNVSPRSVSFPSDPYSEQGVIYRLMSYRHHVTHRSRKSFLFRVGGGPDSSFFLDPLDHSKGPSRRSLQDDLTEMYDLVCRYCVGASSKL